MSWPVKPWPGELEALIDDGHDLGRRFARQLDAVDLLDELPERWGRHLSSIGPRARGAARANRHGNPPRRHEIGGRTGWMVGASVQAKARPDGERAKSAGVVR
jgi:hypothetical protein